MCSVEQLHKSEHTRYIPVGENLYGSRSNNSFRNYASNRTGYMGRKE